MMANSYEEATALITVTNYLSGLRIYPDRRESKCKFICYLIYNISMVILFSSIILWNQMLAINKQFTLEILLYTILTTTVIYEYALIVLIGLHRSKDALALVKRINAVDEKLTKLGARIEYRSLLRHVIISGCYWSLGMVILLAAFSAFMLINKINLSEFLSATTYFCIINIGSVVLYDFRIVVRWLGERFKQTNELLTACILENHQTKAENDRSSQCSIDTINVQSLEQDSQAAAKIYLIHEIRLVHLQLCCVSKMLNRLFETQILSHVFMILIYTTITFYYAYMELIRKPGTIWKWSVISFYILDAIIHSVKLVVVSYNCEYTTSQINKVIKIIHASTLYEKSNDIKDEVIQFSLQISCMRVGRLQSLWLNYGFICQCVGTMLTNVIVMIQWSDEIIMQRKGMVANEANHA
ncbi:unnamed protein product [Xylocopa violacea]|uniref:Gustatory receptor n=1 Tax=Xylocopa violacea TaxID=135666 RepID=A0ABP1NJ53_XYLVO